MYVNVKPGSGSSHLISDGSGSTISVKLSGNVLVAETPHDKRIVVDHTPYNVYAVFVYADGFAIPGKTTVRFTYGSDDVPAARADAVVAFTGDLITAAASQRLIDAPQISSRFAFDEISEAAFNLPGVIEELRRGERSLDSLAHEREHLRSAADDNRDWVIEKETAMLRMQAILAGDDYLSLPPGPLTVRILLERAAEAKSAAAAKVVANWVAHSTVSEVVGAVAAVLANIDGYEQWLPSKRSKVAHLYVTGAGQGDGSLCGIPVGPTGIPAQFENTPVCRNCVLHAERIPIGAL